MINADRSPKYGQLFKRVELMLAEYEQHPSLQLRNLIAATLYPYYESQCRWFKYRNPRNQEQAFCFHDACQECYLVVLRAIELCPGKHSPLAYVLAWIKKTAQQLLSDKPREVRLPAQTEALMLRLGLHCRGIAVEDALPLAIVLAEVAKLSPIIQNYIHLIWIRGYATSEVARQLGVTPRAVSSGLSEARKKLQHRLRHHDFVQDFVRLPSERDRAWQLRMQGIERRIIAERLGVGDNVLGGWFERDKKTRTERRSFKKTYLCIHPDGKEFKTDNLTQFAISQGLKPSAMLSVANGKQSHCEGWKVLKLETAA